MHRLAVRRPSPGSLVFNASTARRAAAVSAAPRGGDGNAPLSTPPTRRSLFFQAAAAAAAAALAAAAAPSPSLASALAPTAASTVLVVGATGRTGRLAVAALRARGYAVRAAVRDPAMAEALGVAAASDGGVVTLDLAAPGPELAAALAAALAGVDAVVCAAGYNGGGGASSYASVDGAGTAALVAAAAATPSVKRFVLLTSLLTNGAAVGQRWNPAYLFLNLFGGVLSAKLGAERALRSSGLDWVIVRPGGLADGAPAEVGNPVLSGEDTLFGLAGDPGRAVSRETVADLLAAAVAVPAAGGRVLELVASPAVAAASMDALVAAGV
jgi:uncharacterized protein YbjT (DUF2867 family)